MLATFSYLFTFYSNFQASAPIILIESYALEKRYSVVKDIFLRLIMNSAIQVLACEKFK